MRLLAVVEATSVTGPAKNLLEFARVAGPMGVEVAIAAITRSAQEFLYEAVREAGIGVEVVNERRVFDRAVIRGLREAVSRVAPVIIQTHAVKSHFLARWAGLTHINPWIAFHHGYTESAPRVRLYNQLDRWSLRAARRVITVSGPFRAELVRRGIARDRIEIVHNAISEEWGAGDQANSAKSRENLGFRPTAP